MKTVMIHPQISPHPIPMKHKLFFLHRPVALEQNKALKKMERVLEHTLKARERWHLLKEHDGRQQAGR